MYIGKVCWQKYWRQWQTTERLYICLYHIVQQDTDWIISTCVTSPKASILWDIIYLWVSTVTVMIHWQSLLVKMLATVTDDRKTIYLPLPPCATRHRLNHFYLFHLVKASKEGKIASQYHCRFHAQPSPMYTIRL